MDSLVLPTHTLWPVTVKDWSGLTSIKYTSVVPQSHVKSSMDSGCFSTSAPPNVFICFDFPSLAPFLVFLICSQPHMVMLRPSDPNDLLFSWGIPSSCSSWSSLGWEPQKHCWVKAGSVRSAVSPWGLFP